MPPLPVRVNSPDISGDLVVDLTDIALFAEDLGGLRLHPEVHTPLFQRDLQHRRSGLVELALHQAVQQVNDGHLHALTSQPVGRLEAEGVFHGVPFLRAVALGEAVHLGDRVVVVGGGNTAMDCARSAVRLGPQSVKVVYRRTRREMPCLMEEVEGAEAEGVGIEYLVAPVRLERKGDQLWEALVRGKKMRPGTWIELQATSGFELLVGNAGGIALVLSLRRRAP